MDRTSSTPLGDASDDTWFPVSLLQYLAVLGVHRVLRPDLVQPGAVHWVQVPRPLHSDSSEQMVEPGHGLERVAIHFVTDLILAEGELDAADNEAFDHRSRLRSGG